MVVYLGTKPVGVNKVVEKEVAKTKFGASADTWIGEVDADGVLRKTTWTGALNFAGVKTIVIDVLQYSFYECTGITSVDLSSLTTVDTYGMVSAFEGCTGITSVDLSSLTTVDTRGMVSAFEKCTGITSVDLSSLTTVNTYGMQYAFQNCTALKSVDLSSLQSVGSYGLSNAFRGTGIISVDLSSLQSVGSAGMQSAFYGAALTTILFPSLTSISTNSFGTGTASYVFYNCTALTEIHFRADMQATIEAMTGYADKWGATNATIYFDL